MIEDFKCIKCGHCCKTIPIQKMHFVDIGMEKHSGNPFAFNDAPCKYFKDNCCSIYEKRPDACKDYPYNLDVAIKTRCKGYHKGKKIDGNTL